MAERLRDREAWGKFALLAAITACAAFFRLHRIESLPPAAGYDAAYYGVDALHLLRGERPRIMYPPNREPLFSYLVASSFVLLGASTTAIHATSAIIGTLTIPAVYFAAQALFDTSETPLRRWAGTVAAMMMAVSYWHLNWSRLGVRAILVPFLGATTVGFLWRGLHGERRADFVLCGASLGLSMYTYQAARLLPILVVVGFVASAWRKSCVAVRDLRHLMIVVAVSLLVFAPLGIHFLTHPGSFSRRVEEAIVVEPGQEATDNLQAVLNQAKETLLAFNFRGDSTPYSTIPGRPSLNPFFSGLLLLGIGTSLLSAREPSSVALLTWPLLMIVPAVLAGKGPTAKRAIGALPPVAMLIALGALAPLTVFRRLSGQRERSLSAVMRSIWVVTLLAGFAWSGVKTFRDYSVTWASNPNLSKHFEARVSSIGKFIGDLPPAEQVYLSPELPRHPAVRFHTNLRDDVRGYNGRVCFVAPTQATVDTTYVIVPGQGDNSLEQLAVGFPEGERIEHPDDQGQPGFISYHIAAGTEARIEPSQGLNATWAGDIQLLGYDLDRDTYHAGEQLSLTLFYRDLKPVKRRYTAFVHLLGPVNPTTGHPLWGQNDSEPCHGFYPTTSWHEGEIVIDHVEIPIQGDAPRGTYRLATGFYDVVTRERLPLHSGVAIVENDALILGEVPLGGTDHAE